MTREERKAMWLDRVQQFKESGKTAEAWSKDQGFSVSTLRYWLRKQPTDMASRPTEWVCLDLEKNLMSASTLSVYIGSVRIDVPENFNKKQLAEILEVLQGSC